MSNCKNVVTSHAGWYVKTHLRLSILLEAVNSLLKCISNQV